MNSRRSDRYSTPKSARFVHNYMNERLRDIVALFQIPGFHHQKFRTEFKAIGALPPNQLHEELHQLCKRYDKSNQEQFAKFKARLRRYLFTRQGQKTLVVSEQVRKQLEAMVLEDGLADVNEAVEQLLFLRTREIRVPNEEDYTPYQDEGSFNALFGECNQD